MNDSRIELVRTEGVLATPGGDVALENNVWIVGDDSEVIVIDASHDAQAIADAVAHRTVRAILLTHGHRDHVNAALDLAERVDAPLYLHTDDMFLWHETHRDAQPHHALAARDTFEVGGLVLNTVHTPGHTPGSVCLIVPSEGVVLSGDTLFQGGPGATRWEYSSFPRIIDSIRTQLFHLPADTRVLPGHGESTTIGEERSQLQTYIDRGW